MLFASVLSREYVGQLSSQLAAGLAYGQLVFFVPSVEPPQSYGTLCLINLQHGFLDPTEEVIVDTSTVREEYQDLFDRCQKPNGIPQPENQPLFDRGDVRVIPVINILKADFNIGIHDAIVAFKSHMSVDLIKNLFSTQDLEGYMADRLKNIPRLATEDEVGSSPGTPLPRTEALRPGCPPAPPPRPAAANEASGSGGLPQAEGSVEGFLDPKLSFFQLPARQQDFLWCILRGVLVFEHLPADAGTQNVRLMLLSMELEISGRERCLEWVEFERLKNTARSIGMELCPSSKVIPSDVFLRTQLSTSWPSQLKGTKIWTSIVALMDSDAFNKIVKKIKIWVRIRENTRNTIINEPDDDKRTLLIERLSTCERYMTSDLNLKEYIETRLSSSKPFFQDHEIGLVARQPWSGVSLDSTPSFWEDVDDYVSLRNHRSLSRSRNGVQPGATATPADQGVVDLRQGVKSQHTPNRCHC